MKYIVTADYGNGKSAGSKAPQDVIKIAEKKGYEVKVFKNPPVHYGKIRRFLWRYYGPAKEWENFLDEISANDVILYQHPMHNEEHFFRKYIHQIQKKGAKIIVIIHDLNYIRYQYGLNCHKGRIEISLLRNVDCVICHNQKMLEALVESGIPQNNLVDLHLFDYLTKDISVHQDYKRKGNVCIAGNLDKNVNKYIYKAADKNKGMFFELFGNAFNEHVQNKNISYHGSFQPNELVSKISADFGIVWAGMDSNTCSGQLGDYLQYNDPHKASLYLAAGIPLIVWKKSAIAKFIRENNCGIEVESLDELESQIKCISDDEYYSIRNNTQKVSLRIQKGEFFYKALFDAEKNLELT